MFFGVPRVYEKFEERIKQGIRESSFFKKRVAKWAREQGTKYMDNQISGLGGTPLLYPIANFLMFRKLKRALGLDQCEYFAFGAAPLKRSTYRFFKSLSILLINFYGLSETSGPQFTNFSQKNMETVGVTLPGTETKIRNKDKDGVGEICFRGRNRFMGYWKNEEATLEAIDNKGYLHSGDQGYLDEEGLLIITGRIKEIIVTAGGENVAPIPIEDAFKEKCKLCSNIIVLGDFRKYLSALITLKTDHEGVFLPEVKSVLQSISSESSNIIEALHDMNIKKYIEESLTEVNKQAISRAQLIRKYKILTHDFSIDTGEFTPTMKLKRKYVNQKYAKEIEQMYADPKF